MLKFQVSYSIYTCIGPTCMLHWLHVHIMSEGFLNLAVHLAPVAVHHMVNSTVFTFLCYMYIQIINNVN